MQASDVRPRKPLPQHTYVTCIMTRHRSSSCRYLCEPVHGIGACGRLAPHSLIGRTQAAILDYLQRTQGG